MSGLKTARAKLQIQPRVPALVMRHDTPEKKWFFPKDCGGWGEMWGCLKLRQGAEGGGKKTLGGVLTHVCWDIRGVGRQVEQDPAAQS